MVVQCTMRLNARCCPQVKEETYAELQAASRQADFYGSGTVAVNTVGGRLPEALKYAYPVENKGYKLILAFQFKPSLTEWLDRKLVKDYPKPAPPWISTKFENTGDPVMKPRRNFGHKAFTMPAPGVVAMTGMDWETSAKAGYRKDFVHNRGLSIIDLGRRRFCKSWQNSVCACLPGTVIFVCKCEDSLAVQYVMCVLLIVTC